jgi:hypothetical protein
MVGLLVIDADPHFDGAASERGVKVAKVPPCDTDGRK